MCYPYIVFVGVSFKRINHEKDMSSGLRTFPNVSYEKKTFTTSMRLIVMLKKKKPKEIHTVI